MNYRASFPLAIVEVLRLVVSLHMAKRGADTDKTTVVADVIKETLVVSGDRSYQVEIWGIVATLLAHCR